jgi:hypothetical protein
VGNEEIYTSCLPYRGCHGVLGMGVQLDVQKVDKKAVTGVVLVLGVASASEQIFQSMFSRSDFHLATTSESHSS